MVCTAHCTILVSRGCRSVSLPIFTQLRKCDAGSATTHVDPRYANAAGRRQTSTSPIAPWRLTRAATATVATSGLQNVSSVVYFDCEDNIYCASQPSVGEVRRATANSLAIQLRHPTCHLRWTAIAAQGREGAVSASRSGDQIRAVNWEHFPRPLSARWRRIGELSRSGSQWGRLPGRLRPASSPSDRLAENFFAGRVGQHSRSSISL
jgi:hypothetical protein